MAVDGTFGGEWVPASARGDTGAVTHLGAVHDYRWMRAFDL